MDISFSKSFAEDCLVDQQCSFNRQTSNLIYYLEEVLEHSWKPETPGITKRATSSTPGIDPEPILQGAWECESHGVECCESEPKAVPIIKLVLATDDADRSYDFGYIDQARLFGLIVEGERGQRKGQYVPATWAFFVSANGHDIDNLVIHALDVNSSTVPGGAIFDYELAILMHIL